MERSSGAVRKVLKRNGVLEAEDIEKIRQRLFNCVQISPKLNPIINVDIVTKKVYQGLYDGIATSKLDDLAAETAASLVTTHPDYIKLAARIAVTNLYKRIKTTSWFEHVTTLYKNVSVKNNKHAPLVSEELLRIAENHHEELEAVIDHQRDFLFDYFGLMTLSRSYLIHQSGVIVERPQWLWMRVAIGIHGDDIKSVIQTYHDLSLMRYVHATPTLLNAGTFAAPQLSSCFLLPIFDDSINGIYKTLKTVATISKNAGGVGLSISNIRAINSHIQGTNGQSNGIVPMLKVWNSTAVYVDQGGGKRKGAFAIYIEPWHAEISDFLTLKQNTGKEERRSRDLFYALWVPDLFMERVTQNKKWSLFSPDDTPDLIDLYGEEFTKRYEWYEQNEGFKIRGVVDAQSLWQEILVAQTETGGPFMLYKDACNIKSNQKNLGTIRCSNLCTEIIEYSSAEETAVCNLATISLKAVYDPQNKDVDYKLLSSLTRQLVRNLNCVIDRTFYPTKHSKRSNLRHRPIGIGTQGQANLYHLMRLDWESDRGRQVNRFIYECIYYAALDESCLLAQKLGPYETFKGSPASEGILQFDMWRANDRTNSLASLSMLYSNEQWNQLRDRIKRFGLRNSLLIALPPTASTSQILNNYEMFEPANNIFSRKVLAGEFTQVVTPLVDDLMSIGLWTPEIKDKIIENQGSIQSIDEIPKEIKAIYKTPWDLPQKLMIDYAAERGQFICQSQSFNIYIKDMTSLNTLTYIHLYGWARGLKTGMYYCRTLSSKAKAIPITLISKSSSSKRKLSQIEEAETIEQDHDVENKRQKTDHSQEVESYKEKEVEYCTREAGCTTCSS